jgi:hypothetical protein
MINRRNLAIYRLYAPVYDAVMRLIMNTARRRAIDRYVGCSEQHELIIQIQQER